MRRIASSAVVALAVLGSPTVARAGGFEVPDLGTVAIGRGGAFTARADNLSAFHYNPAGLGKQSGPNVLLSGNVVHMRNRFTRMGSGDPVVPPGNDPDTEVLDPSLDFNTGEPYAAVENKQKFGPSPMFVFAWGDLGVKGLTASVGVAPPVGFGTHRWPDAGAQRYTITGGDYLFFSMGGGLAYRLNKYFSVGANFLVGRFSADFLVHTRGSISTPTNNEDLESDNISRVTVTDKFVPSANFGVLSQPLPFLELGVSARLPFHSVASGPLKYFPGEATPDARLATESLVQLAQTFPLVLRTGARYIHPRFDLELNYVMENYASVDQIDVVFSNPNADFAPTDVLPTAQYDNPGTLYLDTFGNGDSCGDPSVVCAFQPVISTPPPLNFRNVHQIRLGSDVEVLPGHLTVRAGGFYSTSAYPKNNATYSVRFPFSQQIGVGGGLTWHAIPQLDVSAGYLHIFQGDVTVTNGIAQANAFRFPGDPNIYGNIVNNGKYEMSMNLFGLSVEVHPLANAKRKAAKGS